MGQTTQLRNANELFGQKSNEETGKLTGSMDKFFKALFNYIMDSINNCSGSKDWGSQHSNLE